MPNALMKVIIRQFQVIKTGELVGEDALDGAEVRVSSVVVSDDGHDDVITQVRRMSYPDASSNETSTAFP
jgi:hypothetical protein